MFIFHYTVEDADGDKASLELAFTGDVTLPSNLVSEMVPIVWGNIAPLVNGKLVSASYSVPADISEFLGSADVLSDVQEQALFVFKTLDNGNLNVTLPTFIETFFDSAGAGKAVDLTASEVIVFTNMFNGDGLFVMDGYSPEGINPINRHGVESFGKVKAAQRWGKRRK